MSNSSSFAKTIAIMIVVALATVALFGAEAWNRNHKTRVTATPAASVTGSETRSVPPAPPPAPQSNRHGGKRTVPPPSNGELMNE